MNALPFPAEAHTIANMVRSRTSRSCANASPHLTPDSRQALRHPAKGEQESFSPCPATDAASQFAAPLFRHDRHPASLPVGSCSADAEHLLKRSPSPPRSDFSGQVPPWSRYGGSHVRYKRLAGARTDLRIHVFFGALHPSRLASGVTSPRFHNA